MKSFFTIILSFVLCPFVLSGQNTVNKKELANGVIKLSYGIPDKHTPYNLANIEPLADNIDNLENGKFPFPLEDIKIQVTERGCQIEIPLLKDEQLYGFGLQIGSFEQRGLKKKPIVNDNPLNNLGYTHAPQTFYISNKGYGILINTLRYTTFYCGTNKKQDGNSQSVKADGIVYATTEELYKNEKSGDYLYVDVPHAKGVEIFVFAGTDMLNVVQRYNLFSGGGCMPPLWGLGLKYRTKTDFTQSKVVATIDYLREKQIPCDVIGLEPGWQTAAYSCSYVWNKKRFPEHGDMINYLKKNNFHINLWEHAYVHPTSPIYEPLKEYSGDFLVWNGLVPDFTMEKTREIFKDYHEKLVNEGVTGFKLDECDNSNIASGRENWGFPEMSKFPSGMDGEQMHQTFGSLYVNTLNDLFVQANLRTYQDYRASGMFMSSVPAVLYSDIYGQKDYIQMMCNAAFGGLLWSPEVRESTSANEFFHRLQTSVLSPVTVINGWYLENPPWLQYDTGKNNRNEFLPNVDEMENNVRKLINQRMQLIPYLYDAFAKYYLKGIPPFRPLIMDYPDDKRMGKISDQFMIGEFVLAAPLYEEPNTRKIYLPEGNWYNFNTNEKYEGGKEYEIHVQFHQLPVFVKEGAILPLAKPVQYVGEDTQFEIIPYVYGKPLGSVTLFEDDGVSYNYKNGEYNTITLQVEKNKGKIKREGKYKGKRYSFSDWKFIE